MWLLHSGVKSGMCLRRSYLIVIDKTVTNRHFAIPFNDGMKSNYKADVEEGLDLIKSVSNFWSGHK